MTAWTTKEKLSSLFKRDLKNIVQNGGLGTITDPYLQGWERELQPWAPEERAQEEALEDRPSEACEWDQFKANEQLFGYVSTYKEDLSQYSTKIDLTKIPMAARKKAERVAKEIEKGPPRSEGAPGAAA
eukprot:Skav204157  [mRNA]  locus=scaffold903:285753:290596:+ [translate_table: standard]